MGLLAVSEGDIAKSKLVTRKNRLKARCKSVPEMAASEWNKPVKAVMDSPAGD